THSHSLLLPPLPTRRSSDLVVLTMRADFYSRCAAYPDLAARVASHQYLVSPMDEAGLRAAIAEPAWKVGLDFEDGLIETILEDRSEEHTSELQSRENLVCRL